MSRPEASEMTASEEEQRAYVWTLQSQARVGSYQHEVSTAPWIVLAAEEAKLAEIDRRNLDL